MKLLFLTSVVGVNKKRPWIFDLYLNTLKNSVQFEDVNIDLWVYENKPSRLRDGVEYSDLMNDSDLLCDILNDYKFSYEILKNKEIENKIDQNLNISVAHSFSIDFMMKKVFSLDLDYDFVVLTDFDLQFKTDLINWIKELGTNCIAGKVQNKYKNFYMSEWQQKNFSFEIEVPRIEPFFFVMGRKFINKLDSEDIETSKPLWEEFEYLYGDTCSFYLNYISSFEGIQSIFFHENDLPVNHFRNFAFQSVKKEERVKNKIWSMIPIKKESVRKRFGFQS